MGEPAPPAVDEIDRLDPIPTGPYTLKSGLEVNLVPLDTRQVFRLMRIVTHGAGPALLQSSLDFNADPEEFLGRLSALLVMAIPDAEAETLDFINSMLEPAGLIKRQGTSALTKDQQAQNKLIFDDFNEKLFNPNPADTLTLIAMILKENGPEIQALGKQIGQLLETATRMMEKPQTPPAAEELAKHRPETPPIPAPLVDELPDAPPAVPVAPMVLPSGQVPVNLGSSGHSVPPSTPSAPSTAGQTSTSSVSPSDDSGRSAPTSVPAGTNGAGTSAS
jgi:hypothetical protein